jgi:hypothetical protein
MKTSRLFEVIDIEDIWNRLIYQLQKLIISYAITYIENYLHLPVNIKTAKIDLSSNLKINL